MDDGFTREELILDYSKWSEIVKRRKDGLGDGVAAWLAAWDMYDMACSPMSDNDRRMTRYGHYIGWFSYHTNCHGCPCHEPQPSVVKESLTAQPDPNGSIRPESDETAPVRVHDKP